MRCKAALPKQGFATHSPEIDGLRCKATIRRRKSLISNDDFGRNEPIALQLANALQSRPPEAGLCNAFAGNRWFALQSDHPSSEVLNFQRRFWPKLPNCVTTTECV